MDFVVSSNKIWYKNLVHKISKIKSVLSFFVITPVYHFWCNLLLLGNLLSCTVLAITSLMLHWRKVDIRDFHSNSWSHSSRRTRRKGTERSSSVLRSSTNDSWRSCEQPPRPQSKSWRDFRTRNVSSQKQGCSVVYLFYFFQIKKIGEIITFTNIFVKCLVVSLVFILFIKQFVYLLVLFILKHVKTFSLKVLLILVHHSYERDYTLQGCKL